MKKINNFFKRLIDIIISFILIILSTPIMIMASLLIKITMPGPVFFRQERAGLNKEAFKIYKFRTMKVDREAELKTDTSKDKERLTKTGTFLRRLKIDELPQLINVLKGDMSLVGPRPTFVRHVEKYNDEEIKRLSVKPGMTGLAQINGGTSIPWPERIKYDLIYVNKNNIFIDFLIILKTFYTIIKGDKKKKPSIKSNN